ncbi:uncharacterized protein BDW70DRAFT_145179 [Aspergillus foveolatus]|uniref:uncharacterized protein n=1 Tax=Aspergillus foveolatus TaxID=210207 RepID=UPI003CCCE404
MEALLPLVTVKALRMWTVTLEALLPLPAAMAPPALRDLAVLRLQAVEAPQPMLTKAFQFKLSILARCATVAVSLFKYDLLPERRVGITGTRWIVPC